MPECVCKDDWTNAGCRVHGVDSVDEGLTSGEQQQVERDEERPW